MRKLLLGSLIAWNYLAAQVQPLDKPIQLQSAAAPQPDAHGVYKPGGAVSFPKLIHQVNPSCSKLARKKKIAGEVLVSLVVDETGKPQDVHVIHSVGYGLDEAGVKAVSEYVFRPSQLNGKPVPVLMNVSINFQLF